VVGRSRVWLITLTKHSVSKELWRSIPKSTRAYQTYRLAGRPSPHRILDVGTTIVLRMPVTLVSALYVYTTTVSLSTMPLINDKNTYARGAQGKAEVSSTIRQRACNCRRNAVRSQRSVSSTRLGLKLQVTLVPSRIDFKPEQYTAYD